jgi:glutamyl-tRNA synthetase
MIQQFDLSRVSTGGPVFGLDKLRWMNGKYIREVLSLGELVERVRPFALEAGHTFEEAYLRQVVEVLRARVDTLQDFVEKSVYFFSEDYPLQEKAALKLEEGRALLPALHALVQSWPDLLPETTEPALKEFVSARNLKTPQVLQPLRSALTGTLETPGMSEVLMLLGKQRVLARLSKYLGG